MEESDVDNFVYAFVISAIGEIMLAAVLSIVTNELNAEKERKRNN